MKIDYSKVQLIKSKNSIILTTGKETETYFYGCEITGNDHLEWMYSKCDNYELHEKGLCAHTPKIKWDKQELVTDGNLVILTSGNHDEYTFSGREISGRELNMIDGLRKWEFRLCSILMEDNIC